MKIPVSKDINQMTLEFSISPDGNTPNIQLAEKIKLMLKEIPGVELIGGSTTKVGYCASLTVESWNSKGDRWTYRSPGLQPGVPYISVPIVMAKIDVEGIHKKLGDFDGRE